MMDDSTVASVDLRLDPEGHIAATVACLKCGYNLRGLDPDGQCPECGTAVGRSMRGNFLQFRDPAWVSQLASGMNWFVAGFLCEILLGVLALLAGASLQTRVLLALLPGLIYLIGWWKVTTPDPGRIEPEAPLNARKLVRFTHVTLFVLEPIERFVAGFDPTASAVLSVISGSISLGPGITVEGGIIGLVGLFAMYVYARRLALRIPDQRLADNTRFWMWAWAVFLGASAVLLLLTSTALSGFWVLVVLAHFLVGLVLMLMMLALFLRYRRVLVDAARMARAT